jgi:uncharacterized RDD family membrane protein YckC
MATYPMTNPVAGIARTLADPGRRIVARILDALIEGVIFAVPVLIWALQPAREMSDFENPPSWFLLLGVAGLVYEIVFVAYKGATPGKMAMGIEVVGIDGTSPPGWATSLRRSALNLVGLIPGIGGLAGIVLTVISFVFLFTDERRRTINDRIAPTYVVVARGRDHAGW